MAQTENTAAFETLIEFIKSSRGFDFAGYKRPSLVRRFEKRMQEVRVESYEGYRAYLEESPHELDELLNTILINVTEFFRDPPVWDYVRDSVVPAVIGAAADEDPFRIWVAGCASGEEAYTLAILFAEALPDDVFKSRVKIYATDLDDDALTHGRRASYPPNRVENVAPQLLERYFEPAEGRYTVKAELRRAVIFGRHDLPADPALSRIDLLTARNTLMYFTSEAQKRILANFHFALRDTGFLLLGKSEMMLSGSSLFTPVDLKRRVFSKIPRADNYRPIGRLDRLEPSRSDVTLLEVGFDTAPIAQIVVDREGTLTHANQRARNLFTLAPGDIDRPLKDLELSYRPVELRSRIDSAYEDRHPIVTREVVWTPSSGERRVLDVHVTPLRGPSGSHVGVVVSFVDVTRPTELHDEIMDAKREGEVAYEELQSTVEELETTNEELQSTNEELETTNEELQSTNEELDTTNEELQSTNEELHTLNDELNDRTDSLNQLNLFLESILASLDAGVVVLDEELRVAAWNGGAYDLWGLQPTDVQGRHFMNLEIGLPVEHLRGPLRALLAGSEIEPMTLEATNRRGRTFACRVTLSPLAAAGEPPRGAVVLMKEADPAP